MVIVLKATSNEIHKAQSKTNHTLFTSVFEAQTLPMPSASARVLLSPSSLSVMVSVVCPRYYQSALTVFFVCHYQSQRFQLQFSTLVQLQIFLELLRVFLLALGEEPFCCWNNELSCAEKLTKQVGRSFPSAIDGRQYLLLLRLQIVCQLLYTGWAIVVCSVAAKGVVHHVVPRSHFFLLQWTVFQ